MSSTQQTLAQMVRAKYPHTYDDLSDADLEKSVLAKHPEYGDLPRSPVTPNPQTGAGMEQYAQQQAHSQFTPNQVVGQNAQGQPIYNKPPNAIDKAFDANIARQTALGAAENRASQSPTPVTDVASVLYTPVTAAKSMLGARVGSYAGGRAAGAVDPRYEQYGELGGGLVGGIAGAVRPGDALRRYFRGPGASQEASWNPGTWVNRELEAAVPRNEPPGAREQMQTQVGQQQADAIRRQTLLDRTAPQPPPPGSTLSSAPGSTANPPPATGGATTSTGMPQQGSTVPLAARIGQSGGGGAAAPLTRRIILPGEEIDPLARESAGSAAQATEGDLRRLSSAGDMSAQRELVRRRLPMGPTDYRNMPLPPGEGSLAERVPPPEQPTLTQRAAQPQGDIPRGTSTPFEAAPDALAKKNGVMAEGELGRFYRFRDPQTGGSFSIPKAELNASSMEQAVKAHRASINVDELSDIAKQKRANVQKRFNEGGGGSQ
jgi:hypothetical protein